MSDWHDRIEYRECTVQKPSSPTWRTTAATRTGPLTPRRWTPTRSTLHSIGACLCLVPTAFSPPSRVSGAKRWQLGGRYARMGQAVVGTGTVASPSIGISTSTSKNRMHLPRPRRRIAPPSRQAEVETTGLHHTHTGSARWRSADETPYHHHAMMGLSDQQRLAQLRKTAGCCRT